MSLALGASGEVTEYARLLAFQHSRAERFLLLVGGGRYGAEACFQTGQQRLFAGSQRVGHSLDYPARIVGRAVVYDQSPGDFLLLCTSHALTY